MGLIKARLAKRIQPIQGSFVIARNPGWRARGADPGLFYLIPLGLMLILITGSLINRLERVELELPSSSEEISFRLFMALEYAGRK